MHDDGILVVDLDGTVVTCNTFPFFVRFQLYEGLRRGHVGLVARLAVAALLRQLRLIGHHAFKANVIRLSEHLDDESCRGWAQALLHAYGNPEVMRLVAKWEGTKVLASAAPEACARAFAGLLSLDDCFGSTLSGGRLINNEGETKLERLAASGHRHIAVAISDDPRADAPLLLAARESYVVEATGVRGSRMPRATPMCAAPPRSSVARRI